VASVNSSQLPKYRRRYLDFAAALQSSRLMALAGEAALRDFPKRLPATTRKRITAHIRRFATALQIATADGPKTIHVQEGGPLADATLQLFVAQALSGKKLSELGFADRLRAQQLVMSLAHLDGFLADSVRLICVVEPNTLRRSKTLSWEHIIGSGSWEALMTLLVEDQAYEFGWRSIREKVKWLEKEHGLQLRIPDEDLAIVDDLEQVRHLIIHNGGRVSAEFVRRTQTKRRIGARVPVTSRQLSRGIVALGMIGSDVFVAVAEKYLGAIGPVCGVWQRADRTARPS
jgi:hypothetical protein